MTTRHQDSGLVTHYISKQLENWCEVAHQEFLSDHKLAFWQIRVMGLQAPVVSVTSEAPSGDVLGPKEMEITLDFQRDLRALLESHYQQQSSADPGPKSI